jgi:hypothetical protein
MGDNVLGKVIKDLKDNDNSMFTDREILFKNMEQLKKQKLNIMLVGATGVGKSSTINAIFNSEIAKVGYSVHPETASIEKYQIDNIVLWDTPGLGDSPENDKKYAIQIANALKTKDDNGDLLIDEVVVLIDGSNRDMRTVYEVIEKVILPYIGETERMVVAINQCDMALKGRYWNYDMNCPEEQLITFMDDKVLSVRERIKLSTGVSTMPIYYSALHNYNISKLLLTMIKSMPETKRFLLTDSLNKNPDVWNKNDGLENYSQEIQTEIKGSLLKALDGAAKGAVAGATVGKLIPIIGPIVGAMVGATLGFLSGFVEEK